MSFSLSLHECNWICVHGYACKSAPLSVHWVFVSLHVRTGADYVKCLTACRVVTNWVSKNN